MSLRKHAPPAFQMESLWSVPNGPCSNNTYRLSISPIDGDPPDARPQETSTPIKVTPESERHLSKKKLNVSRIKATHLLFDMQDQQEKARRSVELENQTAVSDWTSGKGCGSSGELPHRLPVTLPDWPGEDGIPTVPTYLTPEAPKWGTKHPHDDDDEITEVPDEDKLAGPLKKKKKKKKSKDDPKDEVSIRKGEDDGACPSTSTVEPEDVADEATPVPASTEVPAEETKTPKKKKKKQKKEDAELEKFRLEQREAKAKRCSRSNTRSSSVNRISGPSGITESPFPVLSWKQSMGQIIAVTCWKEAQQVINSTFPMVQGMPSGDKCTPEFAVRVLMDCDGNLIDCDHQEYGKEQNIGLHDVVSLAAMARVTARETYIVDGIPITIKANNAYCLFCAYTASNHWAINNHVRMHL